MEAYILWRPFRDRLGLYIIAHSPIVQYVVFDVIVMLTVNNFNGHNSTRYYMKVLTMNECQYYHNGVVVIK